VLSNKPDPLIPAREFNGQLPAAISDLLAQAMALDPKQRPADAAMMRALLTAGGAIPVGQPVRPTNAIAEAAIVAPHAGGDRRAWVAAVQQPAQRSKPIGAALARDDLAGLRPNVPAAPKKAPGTALWPWTTASVLGMVLVLAVFWLVSRTHADARGVVAQVPPSAATLPSKTARQATSDRTAQATAEDTAMPTHAPTAIPTVAAATSMPTAIPTAAPAPTALPAAAVPPPPPGGPPPPPGGPPPRCAVALGEEFRTTVLGNPPIQQRLGCAIQAAIGGEIVEQSFEHGSMLWYSTPQEQIYVLIGADRGVWRAFQPNTLLGQPTPTPADPPTGRVAPSSRFGLVWSTQSSLQAQLGWGMRAEDDPIAGAFQSFDGGTLLSRSAHLGRSGSIYVLFGDGTFRRFDDPNP
jgi:hypothetical protein